MQYPTLQGVRILSTSDAHHIFYAVLCGRLQPVIRRLDGEERRHIQSGNVYVWEERASTSETAGLGMERWTDGMRWGPSRVREDFLFYLQKEPEDDDATLHSPWDYPRVCEHDSLLQPIRCRPTPDGQRLVKQTYSVNVTLGNDAAPKKWHLTAYYNSALVESLKKIEDFPDICSVEVPEGYFRSTRAPKARRDVRDPTATASNPPRPSGTSRSRDLGPQVLTNGVSPSLRHNDPSPAWSSASPSSLSSSPQSCRSPKAHFSFSHPTPYHAGHGLSSHRHMLQQQREQTLHRQQNHHSTDPSSGLKKTQTMRLPPIAVHGASAAAPESRCVLRLPLSASAAAGRVTNAVGLVHKAVERTRSNSDSSTSSTHSPSTIDMDSDSSCGSNTSALPSPSLMHRLSGTPRWRTSSMTSWSSMGGTGTGLGQTQRHSEKRLDRPRCVPRSVYRRRLQHDDDGDEGDEDCDEDDEGDNHGDCRLPPLEGAKPWRRRDPVDEQLLKLFSMGDVFADGGVPTTTAALGTTSAIQRDDSGNASTWKKDSRADAPSSSSTRASFPLSPVCSASSKSFVSSQPARRALTRPSR